MIRSMLFLFVTFLLFAVQGCSQEKLPENYGIYAVDGGQTTQLDAGETEKAHRDFNEDVQILVFDRALATGRVRSLKNTFSIHDRAYVRNIVQQTREKIPEILAVENVEGDQFVTLKSSVDVAFQPVKSEIQMLYVKPKTKLAPGLYTFNFDREKYLFGVNAGSSSLSRSTNNKCLDHYVTVRTKKSEAGGVNLLQAMSSIMGGSSGGDYLACTVLDGNLEKWKNEAQSLIQNKGFEKASVLVSNINAVDKVSGKKLLTDLLDSLQPEAQQAFDKKNWLAVIGLCNLAIKAGDTSTDTRDLLSSATENRDRERAERERKEKEAREAIARQKAAAQAALVKKASTPTRVLHNVITTGCAGKKSGFTKVTITDVNILFSQWCDEKNLTVWFGDIRKMNENSTMLYIYGKKKLHSSEKIKNFQKRVKVIYRSRTEGKKASKIITTAFKEWKNKYPSLAKRK